MDYSDIGLTPRFRKIDSISTKQSSISRNDLETRDILYAGAINYTRINTDGRAYQAIVSVGGSPGTFRDIQDALDYVNRLGGGRILVLPGSYIVTSALTIYADTVLEGVGPVDCIISFNSTTSNLIVADGAISIVIANLDIRNSINTNGAIYVNNVTATSNLVRISNCIFRSNTIDIGANRAGGITVEGCTSSLSTQFYVASNAAGLNRFTKCEFYSTVSWVFEGARQVNIYDNYFQTPGTNVFRGDMDNSMIAGNVFNGAGSVAALDLQSTDNVRVHNNYFVTYAILGTVTNSQFTGNVFQSAVTGVNCVQIDGCTDLMVSNNKIDTGTQADIDGINLGTNSDNCIFTGNVIELQAGTPSYAENIVNTTSERNVIVGNYLSANTADTNDGGASTIIGNNS